MKFYKENNINPAASCLPTVAQFPVFIALYFTLRHQSHNITGTWLHVVPRRRTGTRSRTGRATCCSSIYAGSQVASTYFMGTTMDKTQRTIMMVLPLVFITVVVAVPDRPRPLLGDDQPLDGRPGPDHAPADAEAGSAPLRPAGPKRTLADRACDGGADGKRPTAASAERAGAEAGAAAAPRRVKRKKGGARR